MQEVPDQGNDEHTLIGFTNELRATVGRGGFTGRRCVIALPRDQVSFQSIRLPKMPPAEMKQACLWEAASRFGVKPEDLIVDYIATGANLLAQDKQEEVILITASRPEIKPWLDAILNAGLRPIAAETKFTALARFFSRRVRRESDRDRVRAIVEIGRRGGVVMVLRGNQIAFCKTLEIGGEQFDQAVADHLELDLPAAADLRLSRLSQKRPTPNPEDQTTLDEGESDTDRVVYEAVRPLLYALIKEVAVCLRYYGVTFRGQPPEIMILTGSDAREPYLAEIMQRACQVPVRADDEMETLDLLRPELGSLLSRSAGSISGWAAAAGLSVRGLSDRHRRTSDPGKTTPHPDEPNRTRKSDGSPSTISQGVAV